MICGIANSVVVVTSGNAIDTRGMKIKLGNSNIDNNKVIWVLNMLHKMKVDDTILNKHIGNIKYTLIPVDTKILGEVVTLDTISILKDKMESVIDFVR